MAGLIDMIAPHAGVTGLMIFFLFFIGAAVWAFRPGSKKLYNQHANIPLREENDDTSR